MKIKDYLINNGYTITLEEHKSYGSYYSAKKKYRSEYVIELYISNIKDYKTIHVSVKENHFRGNKRVNRCRRIYYNKFCNLLY